jgi:hypothetical protein
LDQGRVKSQPSRLMEWVGNSYLFNAVGWPGTGTGGLAGQRVTSVRSPSETVLFADGILVLPAEPRGWHRSKPAGNVVAVDGNIKSFTAVSVRSLIW